MSSFSDETYVVRYGEAMRESDLAFSSLKHALSNQGEYAVSVNAVPDLTPDEIASRGRRPNRLFCYTTVGALREAGFTIDAAATVDGHTNIILPSPPSSDDLKRLAACFTGKGVNPNPVAPDER